MVLNKLAYSFIYLNKTDSEFYSFNMNIEHFCKYYT